MMRPGDLSFFDDPKFQALPEAERQEGFMELVASDPDFHALTAHWTQLQRSQSCAQ